MEVNLLLVLVGPFAQHHFAHGGRGVGGGNTDTVKGLEFSGGSTLTTGNDSTSVTHTTAWWSSCTSNKCHNWFWIWLKKSITPFKKLLSYIAEVVLGQKLGGLFLGITADFANHHDALGVLVLQEDVETIDEVGAVEGITTNANTESLSETSLSGLVNGLGEFRTGQRAGITS